jgi:hypothetical protein
VLVIRLDIECFLVHLNGEVRAPSLLIQYSQVKIRRRIREIVFFVSLNYHCVISRSLEIAS